MHAELGALEGKARAIGYGISPQSVPRQGWSSNIAVASMLLRALTRTRRLTTLAVEEVDVAIVGGGIGGVALALAIARNNQLQASGHPGVRCAVCGSLSSDDNKNRRRHGDDNRRRHGSGPPSEAGRWMKHHHEQVHADHHYAACFPDGIGVHGGATRQLSFRVFEKDASFSTRSQGYGLTIQQVHSRSRIVC